MLMLIHNDDDIDKALHYRLIYSHTTLMNRPWTDQQFLTNTMWNRNAKKQMQINVIRHWKLILKLGTKHLRSDPHRISQYQNMGGWRTWRWFPCWELLFFLCLQKLLPELCFGRIGRISSCTRRRRWRTVLEAGWGVERRGTSSPQNNRSSSADTESGQPPLECAYAATSFRSSRTMERTLSVPVHNIKRWFRFNLVFQCGKWLCDLARDSGGGGVFVERRQVKSQVHPVGG